MYRLKILTALLVLLIGCRQKGNTDIVDISKEISQLSTAEEREQYLINIYDVDQEVRGDRGNKILLEKGNMSKEYQKHTKEMMETDYQNLAKVEAYLKLYGHPSKLEMSWKAVLTPWLVIHHASDYEPRVRNFEYLYNAYENENLDEGKFSTFLARMYERKFGERLDMGGPYLEKDKIAIMIDKLELSVSQ